MKERLGEGVVDEVYFFDVDGVITVPDSRQFDREIMEDIARRLSQGEPVILNTGRSISWIQTRIIARLIHAHNLKDNSSLANLFVVGEKGGTWLTLDEDGLMHEHRDDSISVPQDLQDEVRLVVEERFPKTMFFDRTKHTMISVEMNEVNDRRYEGELSLEAFERDQIRLIEVLGEILKKRGLDKILEIDPTTIATDIQNKKVGKDFAARKAIAWLEAKGFKSERFVAVGDSKSDLATAEELHNNGYDVQFVFVGAESDREDIQRGNPVFPIFFPEGKFNKGTVEFLRRKTSQVL